MRPLDRLLEEPRLDAALRLQREVLADFHDRAQRALGDVCRLKPYAPSDLTIERNLFSSLFLATQRCAGLAEERGFFYGLLNQCMRAWVTGCDNLLDDEFKSVIPFDLPEGGHRARSVLTIMAADRVCTDLLIEEMRAGRLTAEQASSLSHDALRALVPSALQEHEEEAGTERILPPDELIETVLVPKTGLLFEAPLVLPERIGDIPVEAAHRAREGLRAFGLGCQIFDDIVDFEDDLRTSRHNFLLSLCLHDNLAPGTPVPRRDQIDTQALPLDAATRQACRTSVRHFQTARERLAELGFAVGNEHWKAVLLAVAALLRVPPNCRDVIEASL